MYIILYCRLQSRSQDFARGRRGFFGSLIQPKTNLTQIFFSVELDWGGFSVKIRWSPKKKVFIEIQRFFSAKIRSSSVFFQPNTADLQTKKRSSPKFKGFFQPKSEIQGFVSGQNQKLKVFFRPNAGNLKKKKRSPLKFKRVFPAEIRNSRVFFWPNAVDLKQKKGLPQNSKGFSCRNQKFKGFFWSKSGDLQKIGLHRLWVSSWTKKLHYSGPNNGKSFTTSAPKSLWGGCFHFWSKNRPQKH